MQTGKKCCNTDRKQDTEHSLHPQEDPVFGKNALQCAAAVEHGKRQQVEQPHAKVEHCAAIPSMYGIQNSGGGKIHTRAAEEDGKLTEF